MRYVPPVAKAIVMVMIVICGKVSADGCAVITPVARRYRVGSVRHCNVAAGAANNGPSAVLCKSAVRGKVPSGCYSPTATHRAPRSRRSTSPCRRTDCHVAVGCSADGSPPRDRSTTGRCSASTQSGTASRTSRTIDSACSTTYRYRTSILPRVRSASRASRTNRAGCDAGSLADA